MAAAAFSVKRSRASKLGPDHDEGFIEESRAFEIRQKTGERKVEFLDEQMLVSDSFVVNVPAAAVEEVEVVRYLDETDTGLD
jgi:hypothetical protein